MIESLVLGKIQGKPYKGRVQGKLYTSARIQVSTGTEGGYVIATAFNDTAQAALMALGDGDGVAVAGSLTVKMGGERQHLLTHDCPPHIRIIAAQVLTAYHLKRKRQAMRGDDADTGKTTAPPKRQQSPQESETDDGDCYF